VCPLCCEELDISDREFYPCKCGYQVCMWCWHRIRETESGLCPACRTPYGEDPHQFTAVDVEDVLKANKEREAAAKKERQQRSASIVGGDDGGGGAGSAASNADAPKDRTSLANMRVIRRNLVYCVGLPTNIASEETLKKPEYFGQYGKISKIVLNRSQAGGGGGDPRRASASAYVTFAHKEDTLACILALDGYYLENRNIRASYGTSKYCSAFIKNVRCNNPECTYLHEMGAAEDTFTKQEIQAGYVTSGRDVLARQQQILAEQIRTGNAASRPRKKVGGGGPSGTGRACSNPVFPIPEYDEPAKPSATLVPAPSGVSRAASGSAASTLGPANIPAKLGRANSVTSGGRSPTLAPQGTSAAASHRKSHSSGSSHPKLAGKPGTTAAAVVASGRSMKSSDSTDSKATLTPLTPLKRTAKSSSRAQQQQQQQNQAPSSDASAERLTPLRNGTNKKQNGKASGSSGGGAGALANAPALPSTNQLGNPQQPPAAGGGATGASSIGGDVIGPPNLKPRPTNTLPDVGAGGGGAPSSELFGGTPMGLNGISAISRSSALGGEVFTGQLSGGSSAIGSSKSPGSGTGNINFVGGASLSTGPMIPGAPSNTTQGLWNEYGASTGLAPNSHSVGGSVISSHAPGPPSAVAPFGGDSTSALASILGINLPTGSGSLHESSSLWSGAPAPSQPSPLSALNSSSATHDSMFGGGRLDYGNSGGTGGSSLIGGMPLGGVPQSAPGAVGGGNKTDIALLQSLLPGVHITSGTDPLAFGGGGGGGHSSWNTAAPGQAQGMGSVGMNGQVIGGSLHGGASPSPSGSAIGAIGRNPGNQNQRRGPGIW